MTAHFWIDDRGILHGRDGECREATEAERWFQAERDSYGEELERLGVALPLPKSTGWTPSCGDPDEDY